VVFSRKVGRSPVVEHHIVVQLPISGDEAKLSTSSTNNRAANSALLRPD